ncbi:MAG: hypothetical protein ACC633_07905, partial [Anaerolineales bacterium]
MKNVIIDNFPDFRIEKKPNISDNEFRREVEDFIKQDTISVHGRYKQGAFDYCYFPQLGNYSTGRFFMLNWQRESPIPEISAQNPIGNSE